MPSMRPDLLEPKSLGWVVSEPLLQCFCNASAMLLQCFCNASAMPAGRKDRPTSSISCPDIQPSTSVLFANTYRLAPASLCCVVMAAVSATPRLKNRWFLEDLFFEQAVEFGPAVVDPQPFRGF